MFGVTRRLIEMAHGQESGFTLIELMIVAAVLVLVAL